MRCLRRREEDIVGGIKLIEGRILSTIFWCHTLGHFFYYLEIFFIGFSLRGFNKARPHWVQAGDMKSRRKACIIISMGLPCQYKNASQYQILTMRFFNLMVNN